MTSAAVAMQVSWRDAAIHPNDGSVPVIRAKAAIG
jgi:hypothetical protein